MCKKLKTNLLIFRSLDHNLRDIRQKAFKEVGTKLKQSIEHGEEIVCNSVDLYKSLVVALNDTKNIQKKVLDVLLMLFKVITAFSVLVAINHLYFIH